VRSFQSVRRLRQGPQQREVVAGDAVKRGDAEDGDAEAAS
jgi:hypothetical protein